MKKDWHGILIVDEFKVCRNDEVIFAEENLHNILHIGGESQILSALFIGGPGPAINPYIPSIYYVGLDNRSALSVSDTLSSLSGEPPSGGYNRQPISSTTGFTIVTEGTTVKAKSGVIVFSATGSSWGPVKNIFLTNISSGTAGILYSSVPLGSNVIVSAGDTVSVRFSMALRNC
jgi:hypothetical protein